VTALAYVWSPKEVSRVKHILRKAWHLTGTARDLDVLRESWTRYRNMIAPRLQDGLSPLIRATESRRAKTYAGLCEDFCSKEHQDDLSELREHFTAIPSHPGPRGNVPIHAEAAAALAKRVKRIRKQIHGLDESSEHSLHTLGVQCKKLRYLLEVFGTLYPDKRLIRFTKELKAVQTILGDLNDYSVQEETLTAFLRDMPETEPQSAASVGAVITKLEEQKSKQRNVVRRSLLKHLRHLDDPTWFAMFRDAAGKGGAI
jgi:CHAD domain-containing protein